MVLQMMFQMTLLLQSVMNAFAQPVASLAKDPSCEDHCGKVSIPYPFGIRAGCYLDGRFAIACNSSLGSSKAFWKSGSFNLEVLNISAEDSTLRVNYPIFRNCDNVTRNKTYAGLENGPFFFSPLRNSFIAMGCNSAAIRSLDGSSIKGSCKTLSCTKRASINANSCNGTNCCQTTIRSDLDAFITEIEPINYTSEDSHAGYCNYAFMVEQAWLETASTFTDIFHKNMSHVPVVLDWGIDRTTPPATGKYSPKYRERSTACGFGGQRDLYTCSCQYGFEGNPYLVCRDIDECANPAEANYRCGNKRCHNIDGSYLCIGFPVEATVIGISTGLGLIVLLAGGWLSYKVVKRKVMIKCKEKFFKRNGGLLLLQQLSSSEHNTENPTLFTLKDLEKATDQFNENRILGDGGQGTVYKGMLLDGRIVAIKKSKVIDEENLKEFINEVSLLSRINHRNVVKLLGCCLETKIPLLVYEFVPNGTLFQYLNHLNEDYPLTWDMRLRIATEVAGALFYLHSSASSPIYHRDIKSRNILLDNKYRAKLADFGISRSVAMDQTHLTTLVHGTFGYLDPEYFRSGQYTEKSDVYGFGVVLAELLTGEKAISCMRTQQIKSLATYFTDSMEQSNLFDILDTRVLKDAEEEEIIMVASLIKRCLTISGKDRPTMKEVSMELEAIRMARKAPNLEKHSEALVEDV